MVFPFFMEAESGLGSGVGAGKPCRGWEAVSGLGSPSYGVKERADYIESLIGSQAF